VNREAPTPDEPKDEYKEKAVNRLTLGCMIIILLFFVSLVSLVLLTAFGVIHPFGLGEVCR